MRILIVDKKENGLRALRSLLEGHGYEVLAAANGADALETALKNPPDLVITDILMPVMDGFDLCRQWKKDARLKAVPLIFYTAACTDEEDKEFALKLGAERLIVKPQKPEALVAVIRETIQQAAEGAKTPARPPVKAPLEDEVLYLRQYNKMLIRKLEAMIEKSEQANHELRLSIKEKELLLRELNHRVNNNLQLIINLTSLQRKFINDEKDAAIFDENQRRIKSIAMIHEKLYLKKGIFNIKFSEYIKDLARSIFNSFVPFDRLLDLKVDVEDVKLDIERSVTCGLIINEVISNAIKYAFSGRARGEILISLHKRGEDDIELILSDNGIGMPYDIDLREPRSLGMKLIYDLAEKQLDGRITLDRSGGTTFRIVFKASQGNLQ